jgi:hypothetical protein
MALCRWRSVASLRIYARINPDDYTRFIDDASTLNLSSIQGPNLVALPRQHPAASSVLPVPGSLPSHIYDLVDTALGANSPSLSPDRLLQLASELPELDADNFVAAFNRVDLDRDPAADGSDDEDGSDA